MDNVIVNNPSVLDEFFDDTTMSVHFKENVSISVKKGTPGGWKSKVLDKKFSKEDMNKIIEKLFLELDKYDENFLEIDRKLSKVLQIGPYRVVIVIPPLSDLIEITAVKPIKKLTISDYNLDSSVIDILKNQSQGILISGSPGEGKTTFAQGLVEMYTQDKKIVKTIESPRDLMVPDDVTQYSFSYAPYSEIRDILLLSRPDFTIYDEVRNADDFNLYKDLRLAGIGLVGVIHATKAVDSIQRFLGNIEMGVIPQVIDTIIFIKGGKLQKLLNLEHTVKVPEGMESADLARPVIQVYDFFTKTIEYELYSYGEQVVVMPMEEIYKQQEHKKNQLQGLFNYGAKYLQDKLANKYNFDVKVLPEGPNSIKILVPERNKGGIIGKQGAKIAELEKYLGVSISVRTTQDEDKSTDSLDIEPKQVDYEIITKGKKKIIVLSFEKSFQNSDVKLQVGSEVLNLTTDKNAQAQIKNKDYIKKIEKNGVFMVFDS